MKYHEAAKIVKEVEKLNDRIAEVNKTAELIDRILNSENGVVYGHVKITSDSGIYIPVKYLKHAIDQYKKDMDERTRSLMVNFD